MKFLKIAAAATIAIASVSASANTDSQIKIAQLKVAAYCGGTLGQVGFRSNNSSVKNKFGTAGRNLIEYALGLASKNNINESEVFKNIHDGATRIDRGDTGAVKDCMNIANM